MKTKKRGVRKVLVHSIIAGLSVALLALFLTKSLSQGGLILFASVAATAGVMCHFPKSKSNSLRSVILSYACAIIISILIWQGIQMYNTSLVLASFLAVFSVSVMFYIFDIFHPPAISAVMGFLLYNDQQLHHLLVLFVSLIGLLIILKLLWYIYAEELQIEHFVKEFTQKHYGRK